MDSPIETWTVAINADTSKLQTGLNDATNYGKAFNTALVSAFTSVAAQGKSLGTVFDQLALSLSKVALKSALQPLTQAAGSGFANLVNGTAFTGGIAFANGGVLDRGAPIPFAAGGVIASPVTFPMAGGMTGLAGERGPEAIMPLARGADGKLGVSGGAAAAPSITFHIHTPDAQSFRQTQTQIGAMISRAVGQGQRNL